VQVVMAAQMRLGRIHDRLKRSFFDDTKPVEEKRALYDREADHIEDFAASYLRGDGSVERATALALKAWLLRLGAREDEAMKLFARSRAIDPDAGWGWLFEVMVHLSRYLQAQEFPLVTDGGGGGIVFATAPAENPAMAEARRQLEALLDAHAGPDLCGVPKAVLRGLVAGPKDLSGRERALSRALDLPELGWLRSELLFARAKTRYMRKNFEGAEQDVESVLTEQPDRANSHDWKGLIRSGKATSAAVRGKDPRPQLREAAADFDRALEKDPANARILNNRGNVFCSLGEAEEARGIDPVPAYRKAVEDFSRALEIRGDWALVLNNRGTAYRALGTAEARRSEDPLDLLRRAVEDFSRALEIRPDYAGAHVNRGNALCDIGSAKERAGGDPREEFRRAIEDFGRALKNVPDSAGIFNNRGIAHRRLGQARDRRGEDPRENYRKAIEDGAKAAEMAPQWAVAHNNLGNAHMMLGDAEEARGEDPAESYRRALKAYAVAQEKDPSRWRAWANSGILLEKMGRFGEAVEHYEKAVAIVKDRVPLLEQWLERARAAQRGERPK
jgi:tetratricopeptide (TPR) repeat protein